MVGGFFYWLMKTLQNKLLCSFFLIIYGRPSKRSTLRNWIREYDWHVFTNYSNKLHLKLMLNHKLLYVWHVFNFFFKVSFFSINLYCNYHFLSVWLFPSLPSSGLPLTSQKQHIWFEFNQINWILNWISW